MIIGTDGSLETGLSTLRNLAATLGCAAVVLLQALTSANASDIAILQAGSRATPNGAMVAAGYLTIENRGNNADTLMSASTPHAAKAEIREMIEVGGVMKMRELKDGLEIPARASVELKPGSYHIMMTNLSRQLAKGERVKGSLTFEKAREPVRHSEFG